MGAGAYISSYTSGGRFRSPRLDTQWAVRPGFQRRRPWVPRLMLSALLSLTLFSIIGCIVSGLVLGGAVPLPELALAQSLLFSASMLALAYVSIHGVAAFRDLPFYKGQTLQHPLHSSATIVARIDMAFWAASMMAVPPSFAKLNKDDAARIRPGHVDLVVVGFGLISMGVILSVIETCDRPFIIPHVSPEHITCRLSAFEINQAMLDHEAMVAHEESRIATEKGWESTEVARYATSEERDGPDGSPTRSRKRNRPSDADAMTQSSKDSKESPLGSRPMPAQRRAAPATAGVEVHERSPQASAERPSDKGHGPPYPLAPRMPELAYRPIHGSGPQGERWQAPAAAPHERESDWGEHWAEMKAEAGFQSQGSTPAMTPALSHVSRFASPSVTSSHRGPSHHRQSARDVRVPHSPDVPPRSRTASNTTEDARDRNGFATYAAASPESRQRRPQPSLRPQEQPRSPTPQNPPTAVDFHLPSDGARVQQAVGPTQADSTWTGTPAIIVSPPPRKNMGREVFDQAARQLRDRSFSSCGRNVGAGAGVKVSGKPRASSTTSSGSGSGDKRSHHHHHQTKPNSSRSKEPESQTTNDLRIPGSWS